MERDDQGKVHESTMREVLGSSYLQRHVIVESAYGTYIYSYILVTSCEISSAICAMFLFEVRHLPELPRKAEKL